MFWLGGRGVNVIGLFAWLSADYFTLSSNPIKYFPIRFDVFWEEGRI